MLARLLALLAALNLDTARWKKLLRGAVMAGIAAALTYLSVNVTAADFGALAALAGLFPVVIDYLLQLLGQKRGDGRVRSLRAYDSD